MQFFYTIKCPPSEDLFLQTYSIMILVTHHSGNQCTIALVLTVYAGKQWNALTLLVFFSHITGFAFKYKQHLFKYKFKKTKLLNERFDAYQKAQAQQHF